MDGSGNWNAARIVFCIRCGSVGGEGDRCDFKFRLYIRLHMRAHTKVSVVHVVLESFHTTVGLGHLGPKGSSK